MFNIGDKIFYPMHGAGIIEATEYKEILGESHEYFVLYLYVKDLKLMIPKDNVNQLGLRKIVDKYYISNVLKVLNGEQSDMPDSWNKRYRDNMEKLKTGDIIEVAEVVRDLEIREREKGLSTGEKKMLADAKLVLASEISVVNELDISNAIDLIDSSIV